MTTTAIPFTPDEKLTLERTVLVGLFSHAASVARLVGHSDAFGTGPLAALVDAIVHELSMLLGNPTLADEQIPVDATSLRKLLGYAASAARIVGHRDAIAAGPLGDHIDVIVHELSEILGDPHLIAASVSSNRSPFALDVAPDDLPQHVAPDASAASCTISIAIVPYRAAGGVS